MTLCSPGLGREEKPATARAFLWCAWEGEGVVPAWKLTVPPFFQETGEVWQGTCTLLWHVQLLNVVVGYGILGRKELRGWSGRAWSPLLLFEDDNQPHTGTEAAWDLLTRAHLPFSLYHRATSLTETNRMCWPMSLWHAADFQSYAATSSLPQNVPLVRATGFSSAQSFGRETCCRVGLTYMEWVHVVLVWA